MLRLIKIFLGLFFKRRKQQFLIILQNNNELRATGGFITKVLDITIGKFGMKMNFLDVFTDLSNHNYVKPPKPIQEMLSDSHFKGWTFRDANFYPDFNRSAEKLIEFYNRVHPKKKVVAILSVNYSFIEELFGVIGEIKIGKESISQENLFHFLSAHATDIDRHNLESIGRRKDIIKILFKKLLKKTSLSMHKWYKTDKLIKKSFSNKNLQLWRHDKKNSRSFDYEEGADCLAIIESNFLGGKSNRYIKRTVFRNVELKKDSAHVSIKVLWEHIGKFNYPLSTTYRGYVQIYIPNLAQDISSLAFEKGKFKIVETKLNMKPGEKQIIQLEYRLSGNWLTDKAYTFKYIKQSGVYDETLIETVNLPIQYSFGKIRINNIVAHENTCSIKHFVEKDLNYELPVKLETFGPRIIAHDFVSPDTIQVKFNEPMHFKNDWNECLQCYHRDNKKEYHIEEAKMLHNNTILHLKVKGIPQKEEEFYVVELSHIENGLGRQFKTNTRKATVVYRSKYFK